MRSSVDSQELELDFVRAGVLAIGLAAAVVVLVGANVEVVQALIQSEQSLI
jgi:hypothetical protein